MADITVPRETSEFLPVPVYDGDAPTTEFQVALTRWPARPTDWAAPTIVGADAGVVLAGLTHGTWQVWVKVGGTVIAAGSVWVE